MLACQTIENIIDVPDLAGAILGDTAAEFFPLIRLGGAIEELLIGPGVLNDEFGLTIDCENLWTARPLKTLDVFASVALKLGQRSDVIEAYH